MSFNKFLEKTIQKSQHCNRNWDLSKEIPEDDVKTMVVSVTECSSKQNRVFYKPIFITNRDIIENVHKKTVGFWGGDGHPKQLEKYMTNSQTLANLLVAFVRDRDLEVEPRTDLEVEKGVIEGKTQLDEDRSLGIAAGYLTLTANMLGYDTGCCQCISDPEGIKKDLGTDEDVLLLMGIGYRDNSKSRLEHHEDNNFKFPSFKKEIKVDYIS
jgi:nitroreductase